ncbi:hypothetical protein PCL_01923 [Purpureocillium lilacinum]|uniref:Transposase n=1 Tax=Purpureocillium lilacinum TaxID=33203 RepID=A0A2U3DNY1_PURLI|nr:hypothetical protein PCL_01923 [Purpureocillium lilacinum]
MAPKLSQAQHEMLEGMITAGLTNKSIAEQVDCSSRSVSRIRSNLRMFESTKAPPNRVGRRCKIDPLVQDAVFDQLAKEPNMFRSEMIAFIRSNYDVDVSLSTITRLLQAAGWTRKNSSRVGEQQNPMLRDLYLYKLTTCKSFQLIFIDESGQNRRTSHRSRAWARKGMRPSRIGDYSRGQTVQVLAAYTQEGVELARVYPGSTNTEVFEDFIRQLLRHCGRWPEPKSVIVMDNASFHGSNGTKGMCAEAGVRLIKLPPYSPDLNPIEEFFSELKTYIRKERRTHADFFANDFESFVRLAVDIVGSRTASAEGHFRHSGILIERACEA